MGTPLLLMSCEKKHEAARMLWDKQKSIIPLSGVHLSIKLKKMEEKREKNVGDNSKYVGDFLEFLRYFFAFLF